MHFRSFIYLDEDKLNEYAQLVLKQPVSRTTNKSLKAFANFGLAKVEAKFEDEQKKKETIDVFGVYDEFEKRLKDIEGETYFNLLDKDYDLSSIPPMSLLKCVGYVSIPEQFDALSLFSEYAPALSQAGLLQSNNTAITDEFILSFFNQEQADIPIIVEGNEITISAKLKTNCFPYSSYQILEDTEIEEMTLLCKVFSHFDSGEITFFDPGRDFLKLNRALRRSIKDVPELEPLTIQGPLIKVEVLSIYH